VDTIFEPSQHDDIVAFFKAEGYAVVRDALNAEELTHLDEFRVRTQALNPAHEKTKGWWAGDDGNLNWSQPLLDWPELDRYAVRHPSSWQVVGELMGGEENIRAYQFDFREAVAGTGKGGMQFHHDSVMSHRLTRDPYFPLDAMCTIHYLTDVTEQTPSFAVVPRSNRARSLADMDPGSATLVAIYAPRGR
jgi:ectoine hydroxylase-related dioxygenase (phytanoyl-CoA dioxygenase family)